MWAEVSRLSSLLPRTPDTHLKVRPPGGCGTCRYLPQQPGAEPHTPRSALGIDKGIGFKGAPWALTSKRIGFKVPVSQSPSMPPRTGTFVVQHIRPPPIHLVAKPI